MASYSMQKKKKKRQKFRVGGKVEFNEEII